MRFIIVTFVIFFSIFTAYSSCYSSEMKVYCFGDRKNVSAPFPGEPTARVGGPYKESYMYKISGNNNENNSQFYYNNYEYKGPEMSKFYLTELSKSRTKSLGATITSSNYTDQKNGAQLVYSYKYTQQGIDIYSVVVSVIDNNEYYSWSVQSFVGRSTYEASYIFNNYVKYFGKNTGYCR